MRILIILTVVFCFQNMFAQQPTEISVSLKTPDGKYIGQVSGGGLDAAANAVSPKQTFGLIDLNGGKISDGDKVKIRMDASQWHENKEQKLIHRVPTKGAKEDECIFTLKIKDKLIYFQTPSGKFVRVDDIAVIATDEAKNATLFDIQSVTPPTASTVYTVAFKFNNGKHLGMVGGGKMDASSLKISNNQIFQMIDLNGGQLANGDSIKILFGDEKTRSQLREDTENNLIHRIPAKGAKDDGCIFKILVVGQNVLLQTPSGKFIGTSEDGKSLIRTDKKDGTSLLTAVPNPQPEAKP
jgi:Fascin domain